MSVFGIAIGVTGLLFILVFVWMMSLSVRKKREEHERKQREIAYRKTLEESKKREQEERLGKASQGDIPTILYLAKEAERTNLKEALYWYTKVAEQDNITGMYGVVRVSERVQQDVVMKEKARFWRLRIHAKEGHVPSIYQSGLAYFHGRGVEKNIPKALELIQNSAQAKYLDAYIFLGDWSSSPKNGSRNFRQALNWYGQAAQLGSSTGRVKLGHCYLKGIGTPPDYDKGVYWLERAAEKGSSQAMLMAGEAWMSQPGNGIAIAYIWLYMAAHFENQAAKVLRDQVAGEIGVDVIIGLQSIVKPIIKKLEARAVGKHSIIKALNRLYKRSVPLPEGPDSEVAPSDPQLPVSGDDATSGEFQLSLGDIDGNMQVPQEEANPNEGAQDTSEGSQDKLDFSQTHKPSV